MLTTYQNKAMQANPRERAAAPVKRMARFGVCIVNVKHFGALPFGIVVTDIDHAGTGLACVTAEWDDSRVSINEVSLILSGRHWKPGTRDARKRP